MIQNTTIAQNNYKLKKKLTKEQIFYYKTNKKRFQQSE